MLHMVKPRAGLVSVVLVNFNGLENTLMALQELRGVNWPVDDLEIVVVDNGSRGDDVARIRAAFSDVIVVEAGENLGFAAGCNRGVAASSGEFLAFLNNDARPDPAWISAAVEVFSADIAIGAVASRVLDDSGTLVDFIDAGLTWFGKGYKPFVGETAGTLGMVEKDVLFGTGSAMFVRRSAFNLLGGFDERFFMFYEDVDLGWRLNLAGLRCRYVPTSVAYHRHHGSAGEYASYKEEYLLERNALFMLYKNLEQSRLDEVLASALALTIRRGVAVGTLDSGELDYRREADDDQLVQSVPRAALASFFAVDQFVEQLPGLTADRHAVQSARVVPDRAIWALFGRIDVISSDRPAYSRGYENLTEAFPEVTRAGGTKVLVVTGDPIGPRLAGPAIRAMAMAREIGSRHDVTLITTSELQFVESPFPIHQVRPGLDRAFGRFEKWADVIIFQGHAMGHFESLRSSSKILIADVYDPMHLEQLEQGRDLPLATWELQVSDATAVLNEQLRRADFILCASERQRLFYLGQLAALGRVNPANYENDSDLDRLLAVVPFGLSAEEPVHVRQALRGVVDGIGADDRIVIWSGGLYNWFDPATLIRAVARLAQVRPGVRLYFQGTKNPNPDVPEMAIVAASRRLASELGVLDSAVFFNEEWVDYDDRQNYLLEADAGVSTHFDHLETTFSFRTRILDYLWAGLPMVVTEGDGFAELIEREDLGIVVPERDVDALVDALDAVLYDPERSARWRENVSRVREDFRWSATLAPVTRFLDRPRRAQDAGSAASRIARRAAPRRGIRRDAGLVLHHLRNGGVRVVVRKILRRAAR
jgi:GT2 family glycosyltransferase